MSNLNLTKDPSKVTPIELTASMIAVNNLESSVPPLPFSGKKKNTKSHIRKNPLSKKTSPWATITPPVENLPIEDSDQTQLVSSGQTTHPQDTKRNIQIAIKGFHTLLGDATGESQPLPESKKSDPQDSERNIQLADIGLPDTYPDEGTDVKYQVDQTQSTRFEVSVPDQNKGKTSSEVKSDTQTLILTTVANIQALLVATDEELKDDSANDVFKAGEEIYQPESSKTKKTNASDSESSSCFETLKPYDNYIPITKSQLILNLFKTDHNTVLRRILENLKEVQGAVKEDPTLNKKVLESVGPRLTKIENTQALIQTDISSLKKDTYEIQRKGENSMHTATINPIKETPSHTEREKAEKEVEEKEHDVTNVEKEFVVEDAHYELEEQNQKAAQEAKLLKMNKPKMIKVVQEETSKARIDPKILSSAKGGEVFRKQQDVELSVIQSEQMEKIKKSKELRK
ncbi:hypothetical protein Tco_0089435 [Tanacetum coccineum]